MGVLVGVTVSLHNRHSGLAPESIGGFDLLSVAGSVACWPAVLGALYFLRQTPDLRPQTPDSRPQTSELRPQTSDLRPQTSDSRLQTPDLRPQTLKNGLMLFLKASHRRRVRRWGWGLSGWYGSVWIEHKLGGGTAIKIGVAFRCLIQ
jgi:hypothetical protein